MLDIVSCMCGLLKQLLVDEDNIYIQARDSNGKDNTGVMNLW